MVANGGASKTSAVITYQNCNGPEVVFSAISSSLAIGPLTITDDNVVVLAPADGQFQSSRPTECPVSLLDYDLV